MSGYSGVEGVVYRAWTKVLEQTESGELIVMWSAENPAQEDKERGMNPIEGFDDGWKRQNEQIVKLREREEENPQGRAKANRKSALLHLVSLLMCLQPLSPSQLSPSFSTSSPSSLPLPFPNLPSSFPAPILLSLDPRRHLQNTCTSS